MSQPDELVPDPQVARELGNRSLMTIWRYSRDPELGFAAVVRGRNYRWRSQLEAFKRWLAEAGRAAR
jgi:hypothetical protein